VFAFGLESFTLKKNRFSAQLTAGLLLALATLTLAGCARRIYLEPQYNVAGRPIPPSGLLQRVLASYTTNGSAGGLEILDGLRDLRMNIQDTIPAFFIKGYSGAEPIQIINYPEQERGYIVSQTDGNVAAINYGTETSLGTVANVNPYPPSVGVSTDGTRIVGAVGEGSGILEVSTSGATYDLNLPNVDKVFVNPGNSIILAMVRDSNTLYRVIKLPESTNPVAPPGSIDCEPLQVPVYCVVPVMNTATTASGTTSLYDHPTYAYFSLDGATVDILNCGPECGGTTSSVTVLQTAPLQVDVIPTVDPLSASAPNALATLPGANPVPIPGGATDALSDGTTLYISGQQLLSDGYFSGTLSLLNLSSYTVTGSYPISDGTHTRMLFADDNTLWIGSQQCASGERAHQAATGNTSQAANYNCLTRVVTGTTAGALCQTSLTGGGSTNAVLPGWAANTTYEVGSQVCENNTVQVAVTVSGNSGASTPSWNGTALGTTTDGGVTWANLGAVTPVQIVPAVTPNSSLLAVQYPNTDQNPIYYDNLTGICWVQTYGKVYTAYGGQIHAFNTVDGSERNNFYITVQGTVLDVAYMDALTNSAD
jgi:hypothetical protein